jgi:hypothetical protein
MYQQTTLGKSEQLPQDVVEFILEADTVFIGTSYDAPAESSNRFPSHVGMNQRGGRRGFVRVSPDRRTVVLPDYSGTPPLFYLLSIPYSCCCR